MDWQDKRHDMEVAKLNADFESRAKELQKAYQTTLGEKTILQRRNKELAEAMHR